MIDDFLLNYTNWLSIPKYKIVLSFMNVKHKYNYIHLLIFSIVCLSKQFVTIYYDGYRKSNAINTK